MKRLLIQTNETAKLPSKKSLYITILMLMLASVLTGCGAIAETFGKEYRTVDDFFDQLEADARFSFEEYASANDITLTPEQEDKLNTTMELLSANIKVARTEMKSRIADLNDYLEAMKYDGSTADFIEKSLIEQRIEFEKKIEEETDGQLILKHTEVQRDFLGSVWHFIRNHWFITLIILSVLGTIIEKLNEIMDERRSASREKAEQIKKYGSSENYLKFVKLREQVRAANSQNEILVYGLGGRNNIKSIDVVDKGNKLLIEVKDALTVRRDVVEYLCNILKFEYGIIELSGIDKTESFRKEFIAFLETNEANIQNLKGL